MSRLLSMPTEILCLILDTVDEHVDLYNFTQVHPQLHAVATRALWRNIHLRGQYPGIRFLHRLVWNKSSVCKMVRHVHLEDFCWNDKVLTTLMRCAPHLVSLVLDDATRISDTSMQQIADRWPYLESLYIASSPITHLSYHALGQLPKLTSLELFNCSGLQQDTFSVCFVGSLLERLLIAPWTNEEEEEEEEEQEEQEDTSDMFDLAPLHYLSELKFHGIPFGMLHRNGSWPNLRSFGLEASFYVQDDMATLLVRSLPSGLTRLCLKDGYFTNVTLDAIAAYQPNLIELDVSFNKQLTPCGIRRLIRHCPYLSLIKLDYCGMVMQDFAEAGPECTGTVVTFDSMSTGLAFLNNRAIHLIRHELDFGQHQYCISNYKNDGGAQES